VRRALRGDEDEEDDVEPAVINGRAVRQMGLSAQALLMIDSTYRSESR